MYRNLACNYGGVNHADVNHADVLVTACSMFTYQQLIIVL